MWIEKEGDLHTIDRLNIKVLGIGESGLAILNRLKSIEALKSLDLIAVDFKIDKALEPNISKLELSENKPTSKEESQKLVDANYSKIKETLEDSDIIFVVGGVGGGSVSSIAPAISKLGAELNTITISILNKPLSSEDELKSLNATQTISRMINSSTILFPIDSESVLKLKESDSFDAVNSEISDIIAMILNSISEKESMIALDFEDLKRIFGDSGVCYFGTGEARGGDSPLLDALDILVESPTIADSLKEGESRVLFATLKIHPDYPIINIPDFTDKLWELTGIEVIFSLMLDKESPKDNCVIQLISIK